MYRLTPAGEKILANLAKDLPPPNLNDSIENMKVLGHRVLFLRLNREFTQEDLAERCMVSTRYLKKK
jgi:hypothetical protein